MADLGPQKFETTTPEETTTAMENNADVQNVENATPTPEGIIATIENNADGGNVEKTPEEKPSSTEEENERFYTPEQEGPFALDNQVDYALTAAGLDPSKLNTIAPIDRLTIVLEAAHRIWGKRMASAREFSNSECNDHGRGSGDEDDDEGPASDKKNPTGFSAETPETAAEVPDLGASDGVNSGDTTSGTSPHTKSSKELTASIATSLITLDTQIDNLTRASSGIVKSVTSLLETSPARNQNSHRLRMELTVEQENVQRMINEREELEMKYDELENLHIDLGLRACNMTKEFVELVKKVKSLEKGGAVHAVV